MCDVSSSLLASSEYVLKRARELVSLGFSPKEAYEAAKAEYEALNATDNSIVQKLAQAGRPDLVPFYRENADRLREAASLHSNMDCLVMWLEKEETKVLKRRPPDDPEAVERAKSYIATHLAERSPGKSRDRAVKQVSTNANSVKRVVDIMQREPPNPGVSIQRLLDGTFVSSQDPVWEEAALTSMFPNRG